MSTTIYALSSGAGRSGVAILRVSGPEAGAAVVALAAPLPAPRQAALRVLTAPDGGEALDQALVLWFPGPRSFTGEDVAEFHVHGGTAVVAAVLSALATVPGLKPAEPGAFARRAFDNGKLDLTQIEGLADLIEAETEAQRRQALRQMDGALAILYDGWRTQLVSNLAHLEADLEFPDDELTPGERRAILTEVSGHVGRLQQDMRRHLDDDHRGERLRDGVYVAIVGPPNVGKSSLLNALVQRDAAIVSEVAGTTRDVIEVHMNLRGHPVTLADTAGLRASSDNAIEREGMLRTRAKAAAADLKVVLCEAATWPKLEPEARGQIDDSALVVVNKIDTLEGFAGTLSPSQELPNRAEVWPLSVTTGAGMDRFLDALGAAVADKLSPGLDPSLTRARHRNALEECIGALRRFADVVHPDPDHSDLADPDHSELAAEELRLATRCLGRITGRVDVEDILDQVFSQFCIGK